MSWVIVRPRPLPAFQQLLTCGKSVDPEVVSRQPLHALQLLLMRGQSVDPEVVSR